MVATYIFALGHSMDGSIRATFRSAILEQFQPLMHFVHGTASKLTVWCQEGPKKGKVPWKSVAGTGPLTIVLVDYDGDFDSRRNAKVYPVFTRQLFSSLAEIAQPVEEAIRRLSLHVLNLAILHLSLDDGSSCEMLFDPLTDFRLYEKVSHASGLDSLGDPGFLDARTCRFSARTINLAAKDLGRKKVRLFDRTKAHHAMSRWFSLDTDDMLVRIAQNGSGLYIGGQQVDDSWMPPVSPRLSIMESDRYPVPQKVHQLLRLACERLEDSEVIEGLGKVLETTVVYANRNDPRIFPQLAHEDPIVLKRMYTRLMWEIKSLSLNSDPKIHALVAKWLEAYHPDESIRPVEKKPRLLEDGASVVADPPTFKTLVPYLDVRIPERSSPAEEQQPDPQAMPLFFSKARAAYISRAHSHHEYWHYHCL